MPGVLLGFLEGRLAREAGRMPAEERRRPWSAASSATSGRAPGSRTRYVERLWAEEEWSRGCYGCHMPTGAWTDYGEALRAPIGPLHWAGAETAVVWNGYMDGAVGSGEAAARDVLAALERTPRPV